jgi:membrane associated rhomboid family serine protease
LQEWLAAPTDLSTLATRPWTVITYMFFHIDLFHLLFNMLWLYWFGKIFRLYFDKQLLMNVFILGGLSGVALYIFSYNVFPLFSVAKYDSSILGASAGVLAVVAGIAVYVPDYRLNLLFFGQVKLKYIAIASVVIDLFYISEGNSNLGGHIAHLGGALFGLLFALNIRKRKDITAWMTRLTGFFKRPKKPKKPRYMKVKYSRPPVNDWDYNKQKHDRQKEVDRILDKIAIGGYDTLTREEKETLFQQKDN